MKAFVFTAGLGKRFLPITDVIPKPAIPLLNIPIVYYALNPLLKIGVRRWVCNLHHLPNIMSETINKLKDKASIHFIEEKSHLLGSAGGLYNAKKYFQEEDHFFVVNGDTVFLPQNPSFLKQVYEYHRQNKALATLVLTPYKNLDQYSAVWFDPETNKVMNFGHQKPDDSVVGGHFIGYYLFSNHIFKYLQNVRSDTHIFKDVLLQLIKKGENVFCFHEKGHWFEVGNKTDFLKTTKALLELKEKLCYLQDIMLNHLKISKIDASQVLLGQNVYMKEDVKLSGYCVIGHNVNIGSNVQIHNSVVFSNCNVVKGTSICEDIIYRSDFTQSL